MAETKLHPVITVRLYTDEKCFGPGVAMLLERVDRLHSLRSAAMDMDMAYSKAWTILRNAEKCLGFKLISSTTGGRHGGGAVLTPEGNGCFVPTRPLLGRYAWRERPYFRSISASYLLMGSSSNCLL